MPDEEKLTAIRELLPATGAGIYLNTAEAGPLPAETARAMGEAADWELRTGRAHAAYLDDRAAHLDEARGALAAILHAEVDSVSIAHSAAEALAAVVMAADRRTRIALAAELDPVVRARLETAAGARGRSVVESRSWSVPADADLFVVPHVTAAGAVLPIADLARDAARQGTALLVDGSLAVGAIPVDVEALGVAAYATDAHRWLLGPVGLAGIHVRGAEQVAVRATLEAAPFHGPSVVGLARSAGWLAMYVGLDWVTDRTVALARRLADGLAAIAGVEVTTPRPVGAGIVAFRLRDWPADEASDELERRTFAIFGLEPDGAGFRASVGAFNTAEELDRFADAVALLASHTPETLPRRPSLTILHEPGR